MTLHNAITVLKKALIDDGPDRRAILSSDNSCFLRKMLTNVGVHSTSLLFLKCIRITNLKNLLVFNYWTDFEIIVPWGTLYKHSSNYSDPFEYMVARGQSLFS